MLVDMQDFDDNNSTPIIQMLRMTQYWCEVVGYNLSALSYCNLHVKRNMSFGSVSEPFHRRPAWYCWESMAWQVPSHKHIEAETNGRHFTDDIFKCIFLNENVWIPIKISLKFVPKGPVNNISALVLMRAWRRPSDKPLSKPMMYSLPTHICVTRPQWV